MKKLNFSSVLLLSLVFVIVSSCNKQDDIAGSKVDFSNLDIKLDNLKIEPTLFKYKDVKEIPNRLNRSIVLFVDEAKLMLAENKEATHVTMDVIFKGGKATVSRLFLVDAKNKKILSPNTSPRQNEALIEKVALPDFDLLLNGRCPSGYTSIGTCSTTAKEEERSKCIGSALSSFLGNNLGAIGDCAETRVSVGVFNVQICGRTCD